MTTILAVEAIGAPAAIGPYSQGVVHNGLLYVSGQLPIDPKSGEIISGDGAAQISQCLKNIREIARAAHSDLTNTLKVAVLMTDLAEFASVNEVYGQYFSEPYPARVCYQVVALPRGARVEVEAVIAIA